MWIAGLATLLALVLGLAVGLAAGYAGGWIDSVLMRVVDLVLSFPFLLLAILLAALLREAELASSTAPVILTLAAVGWTTMARVIRGKTMTIARSEHVTAARALGASPLRIILRHILPNVAGIVLVIAAARIRAERCSPRRRCRSSGSARHHRPRAGGACCSRAAPTTGPHRTS